MLLLACCTLTLEPCHAVETVLRVTAGEPPPHGEQLTSQEKQLVHLDRGSNGLWHLKITSIHGEVIFDKSENEIPVSGHGELARLKPLLATYPGDSVANIEEKNNIILRAESIARAPDNLGASINNLWVLVAFVLIFMMQPGFAFLESGLVRITNVINVLFKNTITTCLCGICYLAVGYSLMWNTDGLVTGLHGVFSRTWLSPHAWPGGISPPLHFLFQLAFAMTAATIISGAVAGRIRLRAYLLITVVMATLIYPVSGYWAWNESGWLCKLGFHDFAGSSVVHCVGGFAALAGSLVLGPRISLFKPGASISLEKLRRDEYQAADILAFNQASNKPHNLGFATLGTFFLWMGWFGFNGGSELAMSGIHADGAGHLDRVGRIVLNTFISGCAGGVFAMISSAWWNWRTEKKIHLAALKTVPSIKKMYFKNSDVEPHMVLDLEDVLNGILGGCVAITAGCDLVTDPLDAALIGGLAGIFVFAAISILYAYRNTLKVDDPVGAIAVHAVCGMLGTVACCFWAKDNMAVQIYGMAAISLWSFCMSGLVFLALKRVGWLRVSQLDEVKGLDRTRHGKAAYKL